MFNDKQLVWRCRRGIRELDVLFGRYLSEIYPAQSEAQQLSFQRLLDVQDPVIMDWLFAKTEVEDSSLVETIEQLRKLSGLKQS